MKTESDAKALAEELAALAIARGAHTVIVTVAAPPNDAGDQPYYFRHEGDNDVARALARRTAEGLGLVAYIEGAASGAGGNAGPPYASCGGAFVAGAAGGAAGGNGR